jgi:hypothetical protein
MCIVLAAEMQRKESGKQQWNQNIRVAVAARFKIKAHFWGLGHMTLCTHFGTPTHMQCENKHIT